MMKLSYTRPVAKLKTNFAFIRYITCCELYECQTLRGTSTPMPVFHTSGELLVKSLIAMGELTRSMERKWSCDIPAKKANNTFQTLSAYEVLQACPCFGYLQFLLGGRPQKTLDASAEIDFKISHRFSTSQKIIRVLRFLTPSILLLMFSLDLGDWIVNGEAALHLQQTRIISMLTYLDSQFGLWLGTATTFVFIAKSDKLLHCVQSLGRSMTQFGMVPVPQTRRRRVTLAWLLITALAVFSLFRGVYGIWEASNPLTFWLPRKYFLWRIPAGIVNSVLRSFFFVSEISAMPIYLVFIFICTKFSECFEALTAEIKSLLENVEHQTFSEETFLSKLKTLSLKEVTLTQALIDLDQCFALQVLFFVINNSLGVFSKIAKCFVFSAFTSDMDYVKFILKSFMYVAALGLTTIFPAILHESSARSITLWQRLIAVRQEQRETYCAEEGEVLITLLQRTTARQHSLTVAGIATLTRSFGVTLLLGFAGFTCFLIDRAENYRMDDVLGENITCACVG